MPQLRAIFHVGGTVRTHVGRRELALMRPCSVLINTARGAIVDHNALVDAVRELELLAAGRPARFPVTRESRESGETMA